MIGLAIIDAIDEAGYLRESAEEIADRLGASLERVEKVIALVQTFEPTGIGARDLAECIALQLRELDRFDPAMQAMVANLPLVAQTRFRRPAQDLRRRRRGSHATCWRKSAGSIPSPAAPSAARRSSRSRRT